MITASFSKWIMNIWEGTWSHGKAKSNLLLLGQVLKLTIKPSILALVLIRAVSITMPLLWVNQFVLHVASNQLFEGTAYCKWIVILFSEKLSLRLFALVYVTSVEQFAYLLTRIIIVTQLSTTLGKLGIFDIHAPTRVGVLRAWSAVLEKGHMVMIGGLHWILSLSST